MESERMDNQESDLPSGLAKPAQRALANSGLTSLEQISKLSEAELKQLHGMGPKAITQLRQAIESQGLSFSNK